MRRGPRSKVEKALRIPVKRLTPWTACKDLGSS